MTEELEIRPSALERGRERFARRAWLDAHEALSAADQEASLALEDLWRLSWAAALCGRDSASFVVFERIYNSSVETNLPVAARAAFWLGFRLTSLNEQSKGQGWLARAERCLARVAEPCVESGYLLLPEIRGHFAAGRYEASLAAAERAAETGERFGDTDLYHFARNLQGRILIRQGDVTAGLKLHDEAMLAATAGELSPVLTGLVYCSAIDSCQSVFALDRARDWTESLRGWCEAQPQLTVFTGACLVCRAEVMELGGDWSAALEEARRAAQLYLESATPGGAGEALYRQAEIHRLRGELEAAEAAYRDASLQGREPQPGLALLRLAQGKAEAAVQGLRRAAASSSQPLARARILPPLVDALLASGVVAEARVVVNELQSIAASYGTDVFGAVVARARGAVELAEGDANTASVSLRSAFDVLQQLGAPYLVAQTRVLLACCSQALGDDEGAALQIEAARTAFQSLGALTDVQGIDALLARAAAPSVAGLSSRELEVLRLVASGKTNKLIARELCLSEKTVDRHVSNILAKLSVPSRSAATAFAYENKLV